MRPESQPAIYLFSQGFNLLARNREFRTVTVYMEEEREYDFKKEKSQSGNW